MSDTNCKTGVPQGGPDPPVDSDSVKARVVHAGSMDSGGSQERVHKEVEKPAFLKVPVLERGRSGSVSSCGSAFSNATAQDQGYCEEDRQKALQMRQDEKELLMEIKSEVEKMLEACRTQKNVSMTIKDGLKAVGSRVNAALAKHEEGGETDEAYHQRLVWTEEGRQARTKIRRKLQGQMMMNAFLANRENQKETEKSGEKLPQQPAKKKRKRSNGKVSTEEQPPTQKGQKNKGKEKKKKEGKEKRSRNPRDSILVVKVGEGQTYAGVLAKMKEKLKAKADGAAVTSVKKTSRGDIFLRLAGGSDLETFKSGVREAVQGVAEVERVRIRKVKMEIRGIDPLAGEEDVRAALTSHLHDPHERWKISLFPPGKWGTGLATVDLPKEDAAKLERAGRIKIGWTVCSVRRRVSVAHCFRCLGYGHLARECKEEDRSKACFRCGQTGHRKTECDNSPQCFLCSQERGADCNHTAGSGVCMVFRRELKAAEGHRSARHR